MSNEQSSVFQQETINKIPLLAVLITGSFITFLNQTLLATALPHIMRDLSLESNVVQWVQSIFFLVNGIMIPVTAFLIERFTTRRLFLAAMGLFAVGTLVCAFSPSFILFLAGRVFQAAVVGIIMPLMQTVLFLIFPPEKRGAAMGMYGLVIGFAPAIGPTLSGWVVEHFPWRSLFYIILPIVLIDMVAAYFLLKNVTKQRETELDIISIILSTLGFGGLLYGFSVAGSLGWASGQVIIFLVIGLLTLLWFTLRQMKLSRPILRVDVFKYKVFTLTTVLNAICFIAMIGAAVILPMFMQNMLGFSAFKSGLMMLPGAIVMGVMNPITGRFYDKYGVRWLAIGGLSILTVTTFMFTFLTPETTFAFLAVTNAVRMFGVSMVMMPTNTAGLNQLPYELIPHGTAMSNTMRQMAGAMGTAFLVTVMTNNMLPGQGVVGMINGVNVSFFVAGVTALAGLILALTIK